MTRSHELSNLLVVAPPLEPQYQIILESMFDKVHYRGWGEDASEDELKEADVIFGFLPPNLHSVFQVPRLRLVQQMGAGSDANLKNLIWREAEADKIALASTSGVHVCEWARHAIAWVAKYPADESGAIRYHFPGTANTCDDWGPGC